MIKKLQRKFVLVNMILVSLVLLIAFSAISISSYTKEKTEIRNALQHELIMKDNNISEGKPKFEIGRPFSKDQNINLSPSFSVTLGTNNEVLFVVGDDVEISDEILNEAIEKALSSSKNSGTILSLNLCFEKQENNEGLKIAFVDITSQKKILTNLFITLLLVGVGGLLAFFAISMFLARWIIRPVNKAWEQQRQFIADASHELKTPLTVILANTGILLNHQEDTILTHKKWVQYIKDEGERMKKLVEDMLFLAKSDASTLPSIKSCINLSDLAWSCSLPFESIAFEQGLSLNCEIEPELSIHGDASQLKELVGILLDNACKYAAKKGSVTLTLSKTQERTRLSVHNTGGFIPEEQRMHLFERFYRVDESRVRKAGGYGLGLAIAKSIVDNHHGKINIKSNEQTGTTFEVTF